MIAALYDFIRNTWTCFDELSMNGIYYRFIDFSVRPEPRRRANGRLLQVLLFTVPRF